MAEKEVKKQIGEQFVLGNDFTPKLPENAAVLSGRLLATRRGKTQTTSLTASASPGATTLSLLANVKGGAALWLNVGQADEEPVLVLSVSGTGPYLATLASPLQLAHAANEQVKYDEGASDVVLASTTATVSGAVLGANIIGGLIYEYTIIFLATLTGGQIVRDDVTLILED